MATVHGSRIVDEVRSSGRLVLAIVALSACRDEVVLTAESAVPSEVVSSVPPADTQVEWLTRYARVVAAECPWSDVKGIDDCAVNEAMMRELLMGPVWYEAGTALLADASPALRFIALSFVSQGSSQRPGVPPETQLALAKAAEVETAPLLQLRLAIKTSSIDKKVDAMREPMERFVRKAPPHVRAVAMMNLTTGDKDPAWVEALVAEGLADKQPMVRRAALIGLTERRREGRGEEVCKQLREALGDEAVEVRRAARNAIFGERDSYVEDPERGRIYAHVWSALNERCKAADMDAAYASHDADAGDKLLSIEAIAEFHEMTLRRGRFEGDSPTGKAKRRRDLAVKELTAIAKDGAAPQAARVDAVRGLRLKLAGDSQALLAELAKDSNEAVAKAASQPMKR
jgi:hypothetical protein